MTGKRKVLALLAAFALLAVACGDDDPAAPVETQPPVTVIDTAAQEAAQEAAAAAQAALDEAEAQLSAAQAALEEAQAAAEAGGEEAQMALEEAQKTAEAAQMEMEEAQQTAEAAQQAAEEAQMALEEAAKGPGSGVSVTMARANWSTGYMQAAIYAALLGELGYEVSDPADLELAPSNAYVAMASGEFDFWVNSWLPNHDQFLAGTMPDGSVVSDHVTRLGKEMARAGVQGLITNKAFADANGLTTLDEMLSDPEVFSVYEAADASPGDGVLQIYGCPEGWGCHANINAWLENAGWDNIEQFDIGGYDAMIADAIAKDAAGEPYLVYTWAPSHYVSDLRPGDNAVWVSIHNDPSVSPTQIEGPTSIGNRCTTDPCLLGWDAADIAVIANNDFLAANPAAARLFELFTINPVDVALQNVRMQTGESTEDDIKRHAAEWITENRGLADSWLRAARLTG
jgi:glycine betaine/proline transport system substrate-binding protein